ncbi:TetR/AcrR family transcriptional regulator [Bradyrhizobium sp. LHD-71]|uniref:TetR/AcrR family transcriptional regulator n=1 Tax=Bradyrhizobium sp. LHD-71 TaxID=3072141 RepID=UPI0028106BF2|nr:TetR/AcrR family transcriptional regulator [Bradyrhizobium sp. LHD-71]MDQ8731758.1 TetR/AcrR family transcriptional regulator [Bradyrhizobium sp. LHD-71]
MKDSTSKTKSKTGGSRGAGRTSDGSGRERPPRPRAGEPDAPVRPSKRAIRAAERRQAIVDAALEEFAANGFAAARLDDIAARAGVGKGTIYLYFADKEALFQELVRTAIVPIVGRLGTPPAGMSARMLFERFIEMFLKEIYQTRRGDIIRLMVAEGARFPTLAEFYYREVVSRGVAGMQMLIQYGISRGEIVNPDIIKYPHLMVAPAMLAVIWNGLFGKLAPLDVSAMLELHADLIFGRRSSV